MIGRPGALRQDKTTARDGIGEPGSHRLFVASCSWREETKMNDPTLAERIQRLEDIEALKRLKSRYAEICDTGYDPDLLAPLFTEDAVWDGGVLGRAEGRDAIRRFFAAASKVMIFAIHHVTNASIEVEGDLATGRWHLWQPTVHATGEQALWIAGRYQDEYRREDGVWRFAKVTIRPNMISPYEVGWSRARMIDVPR